MDEMRTTRQGACASPPSVDPGGWIGRTSWPPIRWSEAAQRAGRVGGSHNLRALNEGGGFLVRGIRGSVGGVGALRVVRLRSGVLIEHHLVHNYSRSTRGHFQVNDSEPPGRSRCWRSFIRGSRTGVHCAPSVGSPVYRPCTRRAGPALLKPARQMTYSGTAHARPVPG